MKTLIILLVFLLSVPHQEKKKSWWTPVIEAIAKVESGGNPKAVSKNGTYIGLLQISKSLVDDVNSFVGYRKYSYQDRYDPEKSIEMFILYQKKYNPENNIDKAIRIWNGGPRYTIKGTQSYLSRVKNHVTISNIVYNEED